MQTNNQITDLSFAKVSPIDMIDDELFGKRGGMTGDYNNLILTGDSTPELMNINLNNISQLQVNLP